MPIRSFSSQLDDAQPVNRTVDNDAPFGLRQELVDVIYQVFERYADFNESKIHKVITQSLGFEAAANPYGGYRYAIGRDIRRTEWPRVYDLICRLWHELPGGPLNREFETGVNRVLTAYRIAWDLRPDGQLHRILPVAVQAQVEAAFRELSQARFAGALTSFREGMAAFDDRPQRGRDACKNTFDALESVSKEVFGMPTATFGNVLTEARKHPQRLAAETISVLQKLYDMANNHFRHGMIDPFTLKPAEVDFVVASCTAGILLFVRL